MVCLLKIALWQAARGQVFRAEIHAGRSEAANRREILKKGYQRGGWGATSLGEWSGGVVEWVIWEGEWEGNAKGGNEESGQVSGDSNGLRPAKIFGWITKA